MAISLDYSVTPWLITIPQSDLTLDTGTKYKLTVDTFWQLLRDYSDSAESMPFPILFTRIASTASTPSITEINEDYYELQFEDGSYSVNIINGNTNIRDVEVKNSVSVNTNNTTGFIDPTFLEAGLFNNGVAVDVVEGYSGTTYTPSGGIIGTRENPSNNIADAHTIAVARGLNNFFILESMTLATENFHGHTHKFIADSPVAVTITVDTSTNITNCEFINCTLQGTLDGGNIFRECIVLDVNYINGFLQECALGGTITLGGGAQASLWNCFSNVAGGGEGQTPTIDMGGTGNSLAIRDYHGGIKLTNCTGGGSTSIDMSSGRVLLDSTISSGDFYIRGVAFIEDSSTGTTVVYDQTNSALTTAYLERAVWIDTEQVAAGNGSQASPFNSLTSAVDYAEEEGIKTLYVYADITLDRQLKNFKIVGIGTPTVDTNGQNLDKSEFWHVKIQGTYTGSIIVQQSVLLNNFELNGFFEKNALAGDLTCIDGSTVFMLGCSSAIAGIGRPTISMNGLGSSSLSVRDNNGGMTITDCNNISDKVTVEVNVGSLTFDSTCTNGEMVARGNCTFVDNSNGATVYNEVINNDTIARSTMSEAIEGSYTIEEVMRLLSAALAGKLTEVGNVVTIRDINDTKDRIIATTDDNGQRTAITLDVT